MSEIKKHKIIYCDICGIDVTRGARYRFSFYLTKRYKEDMCQDCYLKFRQFVKDNKKGGAG